MPRALTVNDATVLKLTMLAVLERYSTFDHIDLDDINSRTPAPAGPADQIMDAINRVRIDGKPIVRVHRTIERGRDVLRVRLPARECRLPRRSQNGLPGPVGTHARAHQDAGVRRRTQRHLRGGSRQGDARPSGGVHRDPATGPIRCTDRTHRAGRRTQRDNDPLPRRAAVDPAPSGTQGPQAPPSRNRGPLSGTLPVMILTATSRIEGMRILQHHDMVTGGAIVGANVFGERHRAPRRSARRPHRARRRHKLAAPTICRRAEAGTGCSCRTRPTAKPMRRYTATLRDCHRHRTASRV